MLNSCLSIVNSNTSSLPSNISSNSRRPSGPFPIKLRNPPAGRRSIKGNNNPPVTVPSSKTDQLSTSEQPPPIPPRSSLLNTTNKRVEGQFVRSGETPIKAKRTIFRSRNVRRREPAVPSPSTETKISKTTRSDSADALSVPSAEHRYRHSNRRPPVPIEQGTNSD